MADRCASDRTGPRGDGRYNTRQVAGMLRRSRTHTSYLCQEGRLDAIRSGPTSPWWIKIDSPEFEQLRQAMQKCTKLRRVSAAVKTCTSC